MIKLGGRPGIPFRVTLTPTELQLHDTSKLWHQDSRRGELARDRSRCDRIALTGTRPARPSSRR